MKITNDNIKQRLKRSIEVNTPDVLPAVLQYMQETDGGFETMIATETTNEELVYKESWLTKLKSNWTKILVPVALTLAIVFGAQGFMNNLITESVINLDVNPSIEIKINRNDKVREVMGLNEEGIAVIEDMNFKNTDLDITVNALIGSMVKNGYLTSLKNSILISVDSNNKEKGPQLQAHLSQEVDELLKQYDVEGAVLSQNILEDEKIKELAEKHQISVGKAALVDSFVKADTNFAFEDLAGLSINDLNLLIKDKFAQLEGVNSKGQANDFYLGKEKERQIALLASGVHINKIDKLEIEMDYEKGRLVYEVELKSEDIEYEYDIDAKTGEIVEIEIKNKKPIDETSNDRPDQIYISKEEARQIALNAVHVHVDIIEIIEIEMDYEKGRLVYEVELKTEDEKYEYDIDAKTGEIIKIEIKRIKPTGDTSNGKPNYEGPSGNYIGIIAAKDIALKHAGLSEEQIYKLEVELDTEDGIVIYEVEFKYDGYEYEYEINATTGKILSWEVEIDD
ncbi:MAG: hypothetical protein GX138_04310 [Firmicutes bacterium]|nr:hypothetical protein [Bacillota bacterium]